MNSELFVGASRSWILIVLVLLVAINDLRHYRISNYSVVATLLAGLFWSSFFGHLSGFIQSLLGVLVGFLLLILLYGMGGVTAGDVKWLAALGAWYGPKGVLGVFLASGGILGILSLGWMVYGSLYPLKPESESSPPPLEIDRVYQSSHRRRWMIPYALPIALGVLLIELSRILIAGQSG